jgi:two-component sensor histidine kinase
LRTFSDDDVYFLQSVANIVSGAIERKTHEERREMLTRELSHRVKNNLAIVRAIASQSARRTNDIDEFLEAFGGRLAALTQAHDLLTSSDWVEASLKTLLTSIIQAQAADDRVLLDIEDVNLNSYDTQTMTLLLHELTTNALKHGALTRNTGTVMVRARLEAVNESTMFNLSWQERGGPPVEKPGRLGFGSSLMAGMIKHSGGDLAMNWDREGFSATIKLPLSSNVGSL